MAKSCFVISVIGSKGSENRKYADRLFTHLIEPCAKASGYETIRRADHIDEAGMITIQVVEAILNSDLVIADLTHENPNVYYELAIRHFTGKRLVQLVQKDTKLPFDVAGVRSVQFELDLDGIGEARAELTKKIKAAEGDEGTVTNPITQSKEVNVLKESSDSTAHMFGRLMESHSSVVSMIKSLKSDIADMADRGLSHASLASLGQNALSNYANPLFSSPNLTSSNLLEEAVRGQSDIHNAMFEDNPLLTLGSLAAGTKDEDSKE